MVIGIGKGREIGRAEKKSDGIKDGRLANITAAENDVDTSSGIPRKGLDTAEALDRQLVDGRCAHLILTAEMTDSRMHPSSYLICLRHFVAAVVDGNRSFATQRSQTKTISSFCPHLMT